MSKLSKDFAIGDVVVLKSGGQALTVYGEVDGEIIVHWFANDRKVSAERFRPEQLFLKNVPEDLPAIDKQKMSEGLKAKLKILEEMSEQNWTIGDVVRLNSGGPDMSVRSVAADTVNLDWLDAKGEHRTARFHPAQLSRAIEEKDQFADWSNEELEELQNLVLAQKQ